MKLLVKIKTAYGNVLIYPANDIAERFAKLIGKKTFNQQDLDQIKALGYAVEQVLAFELSEAK